jgi:hypothetical protein
MATRSDQYSQTHRELRRALNDDRRKQVGDSGGLLAPVCECGDPLCHRTIVMTPHEYDTYADRPIVHPSHRI